MTDPDDPVVASYDVFLAPPAASASQKPLADGSLTPPSTPKVLVLQYPAYRPSSRPYSAARSQKPSELRLKPNTGLVEIDVPILTNEHYNQDSGARYGKALSESKILHGSSSHGLAGGFHAGSSQSASLQDVPAHDDLDASSFTLKTQTLGGKITELDDREPVYFLGSLQDSTIHLSHLDGVVQMRPQLHHLDAEEVNQKQFPVSGTGSAVKSKAGSEPGPSKLESRAIEIKLKDTKDDGRDRTLNENARLLRDVQIDSWRSHTWMDQDHALSHAVRDRLLADKSSDGSDLHANHRQLRSSLSNGDWLDKMSAPREDGKKGLLAKLRGRERERARRKKAEEEKKQKSRATGTGPHPGTGPLMDQSSDSEASSGDATDVDMDKQADNNTDSHLDVHMEDVAKIKDEPEPVDQPSSSTPAKKRGRPKKVQQRVPIEVDD